METLRYSNWNEKFTNGAQQYLGWQKKISKLEDGSIKIMQSKEESKEEKQEKQTKYMKEEWPVSSQNFFFIFVIMI